MIPQIKPYMVTAMLVACLSLVGCSKSESRMKPNDTTAMTPEQKAARDLQKSNDAVTAIDQKIGRKLEPMDIGVPSSTTTTATTTPASPPKKE